MSTRTIDITNDELKSLHANRLEIQNNVNSVIDEMAKLEEQLQNYGMESQKTKNEMQSIIDGLNIELSEFEYISKVDASETGVMVFTIVDRIEDFKEKVREAMKKEKENKEKTKDEADETVSAE